MSLIVEANPLSYEDILISNIGAFGKAQTLVLFASIGTEFFCAWGMLAMSFSGMEPDWWSVYTMFNETTNTSTMVEKYQECHENGTVRYTQNVRTIVNEWGLICDKKWIPTLITTMQMVGVLLGGILCSHLGDWMGRRKSLLFFFGGNLLFSLVEGFSPYWQMMATCRFFVGIGVGGSITLYSIYILEFIGKEWRTSVLYLPAWAVGVICLGALFKVLSNWRHLCFANASFGLISLVNIWFSPESPRWMLTKGKVDEATKIIKKLTRINGRVCQNLDKLEKCINLKGQTIPYTYIDLLRFKEIRYQVLSFAFMVMYFNFGYYGLTLGVSDLDGDATNNLMIMGACDVANFFIMLLVTKYLARKKTTIFFIAGASLTSFVVTIVYFAKPSNSGSITNGFALTSRFFISSSWIVQLLFSLETFPTEIRTLAYGFTSVFGRIGGILAPQNKTLHDISGHLPFTVNGILGLISVVQLLFFKDTYDKELIDLLQGSKHKAEIKSDIEDENKKMKSLI